MTQPAQEPILTLTQMRERLFYKNVRLMGGIAQEVENPQGDPHSGMLSVPVEYDHYEMIRDGKLDILIRPNIEYWTTKLNKRNYKLIKLVNLLRGKPSRVLICEYEGFFTAKSNHLVSMNGSRRLKVNAGDFILKIIKPIKEIAS
jgi:hypothetical protein